MYKAIKKKVADESKIRVLLLMRIFFSAKGDTHRLKKALEKYIEHNNFYLNSLKKVEEKFVRDKNRKKDNDQIYWLMTIKKGYYTLKQTLIGQKKF